MQLIPRITPGVSHETVCAAVGVLQARAMIEVNQGAGTWPRCIAARAR